MNRLEFDLDSLRESQTSIDLQEDELFREQLKIAEAQSLLNDVRVSRNDRHQKAKQKSASSSEVSKWYLFFFISRVFPEHHPLAAVQCD